MPEEQLQRVGEVVRRGGAFVYRTWCCRDCRQEFTYSEAIAARFRHEHAEGWAPLVVDQVEELPAEHWLPGLSL